ncbi:MAG: patatin-like protein [Pseudomonadales bacterium]
MAKRELRLAVVIYGGASLAVYMHGVTKELLKLVRASKVLHEIGVDGAATTAYSAGPDQRPHDTEAIYFELLKQLNEKHHTRVVIDVIAGASAGAINGVMLAKALVDDATLDAHTDLWLSSADADELRGESVSRLRKWYLYPFLRALSLWLPDALTDDDEVRGKLTRLVRTSWFRAPFSGSKLCHRFLEALDTMRRARRSNSTLLPPDQRLDVYASITDLFGYPRMIRLHDRLVARESAHGAYCRLTHVHDQQGEGASDFADDNIPALVWAARASSSYAGAFAPFQHKELMQVLEEREQHWPGENRFLRECLFDSGGNPATALFDPRQRLFLDGGIVNNKPFGAALEALQHRPADRKVERVILYVEPDPNLEDAASSDRALGYLGTIRAAASSIPRNQPIADDLQDIMDQDLRARSNRRVIENNRHAIAALVEKLVAAEGAPSDIRALTAARRAATGLAAKELGLGYRAYVHRRLWRLSEALAEEWAILTPELDDPERRSLMLSTIYGWWKPAHEAADSAPVDHAAEDAFLSGVDVSYRIRWVQYVIRRLNQQDRVQQLDSESQDALSTFKREAYAILDGLYLSRRARGVDPKLAVRLIEAARALPLPAESAAVLLRALAASMDLAAIDKRMDAIFSKFYGAQQDEQMRSHMLTEYLGFPLYDALLLSPGSEHGGPDPLTELRVERVSPADADSLASAFSGLKCRQFMGFLGFFNRGFREHDYLWGRLNGAERVVDLLSSLLETEVDQAAENDVLRRLFERILSRERARLHQCEDSLARVSEVVKGL